MPWAALRWIVAEKMGWTLDYVDELGDDDLMLGQIVWGLTAGMKG